MEKEMASEIEERDGSGRLYRRWIHEPDGRITEVSTALIPFVSKLASHHRQIPVDDTTDTAKIWQTNIRQVLCDAFLPIGYPDSVTPDYLGYQTYDSLQAFFSTITSLLANRAILQGLGVGDANSSATYALLLTILKDGISRVATIAFAYRFGLVIEPECKKYRFLADIFNDSAFFLDLFSPLFGTWTKIFAIVAAEALRAMCGVAAGASKAALSKHFARRNNLSELNAKESSQETAVGLVGLIVGSIVVRYVESREAVFTLMVILVFVHLGMNYLGVRCVQLNILNQQRATILFDAYLNGGKILSPAEVAAREAIIFWKPVVRTKDQQRVKIVFARSYADAMVRGATAQVFRPVVYRDLDEKSSSQLVVCRSGPVPVIKILLYGDPLRNAKNSTSLFAWYSAQLLVHLGLDTDAVDENAYGEASERFFFKLEEAGWCLDDTNLDASAPWMTIGKTKEEDKKER
ncbi:duf647 domain-containing protein [Colletotrichum karsti]|uniref:Duf647 domain-containing protein n=1 Tax=Colletotrichum karsti TaxID=1095194 RepID=A0A9P6I8I7_9PEZI|nr:duf647 domain-containing protein [Colletotrichum karsti]KAF9878209.1 duf647 domain-containing protein [Colletotrichum karsti]